MKRWRSVSAAFTISWAQFGDGSLKPNAEASMGLPRSFLSSNQGLHRAGMGAGCFVRCLQAIWL
jgi:hypothetical protein